MKKVWCTLGLVASLSVCSYAQLSKGNVLLGGSVNFSDYSDQMDDSYGRETDITNLGISPNAGLFLTDRFVLGIRPGFNYERYKIAYTDSNGDQEYTNMNRSLSIGPFIRYYASVGERVSFFGEAGTGFSFGKREEESLQAGSTTSYDAFGAYVNVRPGIVFFATPKLGVEITLGTLGYTYNRLEAASDGSDWEQTSRSFNFDLSLSSVSLGVQYYLGK